VIEVTRALRIAAAVVALGAVASAGEPFTILRVASSHAVKGFDGKKVEAAPGNRFVTIDVRVAGPIKGVDADDFQLVREKAPLGREKNLGDNTADGYFFWAPLDKDGHPVESVPADATDCGFSLSFQIPEKASSGYLLKDGAYLGPIELPR